MTTLTLTIPDELVAQAKAVGVFDEVHILQAFNDFIQGQSQSTSSVQPKRIIGTGVGTIIDMPKDFNEPLEDFADYM